MLMSGEMSGEAPRELTTMEKFDRWMVNEGYRRLFVFVFAAVHAMIFAFGFMNYDLKDNLTTARSTFTITYPIARSAALVLHFDIAFILFREFLRNLECTSCANVCSCLPYFDFFSPPNATERYHSIWYASKGPSLDYVLTTHHR